MHLLAAARLHVGRGRRVKIYSTCIGILDTGLYQLHA